MRPIAREEKEVQASADVGLPEELAADWRRIQSELRASVPVSTYSLWFAPLRPVSARGPTLFLTGPAHVRRWVARRYPELLRAALAAGGRYAEAELVSPDSSPAPAGPADAAARVALNPDYTFERFVIGPGNRLAHAAALAVAEAPGQAYNPLFLHGPPGLGKTHLLGAIANYLHHHNPELLVKYTTAESFTNEFVGCLQGTGIASFKQTYRRADVLLIDDIQFLEGKAQTAEEFFHTFNALYENGAQVVLTADRIPAELSRLAERLRQRFEWGLIAEVEPPDLSTRLIVLANLVRDRGESIAPDSIRAIASRAASNLRMLEGALTRVVALSSLTASKVTPEVVADALPREDVTAPAPPLEVDRIQAAVAARHGLERAQLLSSTRAAPVARARQLAMYLSRELTDLSLPAIAAAFDRRDHTTVLHAIRRVEERIARDAKLTRTLESLREELTSTAAADTAPRMTVGRDRTD